MSISTKSQSPVENRLLASLPDGVFARLLPHLQPASFALGGAVYESSERMERLYFPTTCIVSLLYTMTDGATAEMGLVGNDGIVGVALFMGGNTVPNRAVAQVAGGAFSVPAPVLLEEFRLGGPCQLLLLRYTQALITQISQTAGCCSPTIGCGRRNCCSPRSSSPTCWEDAARVSPRRPGACKRPV
jgi:hypothetical protein